jgi:ATP-dependent exoDNAse (exonuclease V) beta subunit
MPSCNKARNPHGIEIKFEEESHRYSSIIDGKEITYVSGTSFVSKFFPQFDPTGVITRKCAQKRGLTVEALKQQWREKANRSCAYGTKIHECCEDTLLGRTLRNRAENPKEEFAIRNAVMTAEKVRGRSEILGVEKIIFDEDLRIAGTIDLLIRAKKNNQVWICDWKTNEKLSKNNTYNDFGLPPIEHIPNTSFGHYTCQLNLYEYLLKKVGYIDENEKVGKVLFHITENGTKSFVLDDIQKEIGDMIDVFNKKGGVL